MSEHINPQALPSGNGCVECDASQGWWFHLRRCASCGHIGCCDSSPSGHATLHSEQSGHAIIASYEPGEAWFYDYRSESMSAAVALAEPRWHPRNQAVPGPHGRVPADWQSRLR